MILAKAISSSASNMCMSKRNYQGECTAVVFAAFYMDAAAMSFGHVFGITQSEAETFHVVSVAVPDAVKAFEDAFLLIGSNTDAIVGNAYFSRVRRLSDSDVDVDFLARIFDGIIQQVLYHLFQM